MRRVVISGLGLVTPLGVGVRHAWENALAGRSGVRRIDRLDTSDLPVHIAGLVPRGRALGELDPDALLSAKEQRRTSDFILYALAAADEALLDSGWTPAGEVERDRTGVMIGSGIGGLDVIEEAAERLASGGPRRVSPFFIPAALVNEAASTVAIRYGFGGPTHAVATACSTGAHAIGDAARMIQLDDADVMIAGGSEAAVTRLAISGFAVMGALSKDFNDHPSLACRPWDRDRDGFVLAEGAGVVILEERDHAMRRGAKIYGELLGYGLSGDAHHVVSPDPSGRGALRAMRAALARARLDPSQIDYLNAHATSTPVGDPIELSAIRGLFGVAAKAMSVSSTKSSTGHLLGAAGAVEAIFSLLAIRDQVAPPTINLHASIDDSGLDLVPHAAKPRKIRHVLSNSFAFGGANASLIFGPA
jgi:3-oxoacyl-[acyl-carrier-protein] synthase II